jgi:aspartyl protease family protein
MRGSRRYKAALLKATRAQDRLEEEAQQYQRAISNLVTQYGRFNAELANTNEANLFKYNQLISKVNQASAAIRLAEKEQQDHAKQVQESRKEAAAAREEYLQNVIKMRGLVDEVQADYAELQKDAAVVSAIESLNAGEGSIKLGASRSFTSLVKRLETLEESMISEAIPLRSEGLSYFVSAVFNDEHTQELIVDSGANLVSLSEEAAKRLGVETEGDAIKMRVADGRTVDATLTVVPLLRIGTFEVSDVDAVVVKQNAAKVPALLGMSFLRHFKFELNADAGTLTLTKVEEGQRKKGRRPRRRRRSDRTE